MRKTILVVSCLSILTAVLLAATEQRLNVKTGVWQVEYNVKYSGLPPQLQAMVDQMSAQQRAQWAWARQKHLRLASPRKTSIHLGRKEITTAAGP